MTMGLARRITAPGYFVLAFGTIVGSAWMVLMGEWVAPAGPGGAMLAFIAMCVMMVPMAGAYAELMARVPRAGSESVFVEAAFGGWAGFFTGWFLTLYFIGICVFEGLTSAWFLGNLIPPLGRVAPLYTLFGKVISAVDLVVGLSGVALMTFLNASGARLAVGFQKLVTFSFLGASALLAGLGLMRGNVSHWQPLFTPAHHGDSLVLGLISLMPVAVMWLNGFQPAASAVEERAEGTSFASVARAMMLAVVVAALFYSAMIAASSALVPWRELTTGALPVAAAFDHALPDGMATRALLIVALASLLKTWNAMHLSATRVLLAQGRAGFLPPFLARITPQHGAPRNAALLVGAIAALGVLAGRGAIGPIISMGTICNTAIAAMALLALWRLRGMQGGFEPAYRLRGGLKVLAPVALGAVVVAGLAVWEPFRLSLGLPLEIMLMAGWGAIGLLLGWLAKR